MVSTKDNWQKDWKHDAAASSSSTKPIQINKKDQLARTVKPVTFSDRVRLDQESTTKHVESDSVKCDLISTGQPIARDEELIAHQKLTSGFKDYHTRQWKNQNIYEFENS